MMNKKSNISHFVTSEWILLVLLLVYLFGMFASIGQYLTLMLLPLLFIKDRFWRYFDSTSIWIIVFSVSYAIISTIYGSSLEGTFILFSIFPLMLYITGRYLMDKWYAQRYLLLVLLMVPIAFTAITGVLNDIFLNGLFSSTREVLIEGSYISVTNYGLRLSLCIAAMGMVFSTPDNKRERVFKYLLIILGMLGLICTVHMLNRTGVVIAVVSCFLVLLVNLRSYSFFLVLISIILLSIVGYALYPEIKKNEAVELYADREEGESNTSASTAGGRTTRWADAAEDILKKPLGGGVYKNGHRFWAHNYWLDVSEIVGILPFIALLGCTIINLRKNIIIIRSRFISSFLRSWLIILNIGFFLACSVEPVLEGYPKFAFLFFCFWGMTSSIYNKIRIEKQRT